jgi:hypothetical protein
MKSQRDILRDEFNEVLSRANIKELIKSKKLKPEILSNAFERLLDKNNGSDDKSIIEDGRSRFEAYIINTLQQTKK